MFNSTVGNQLPTDGRVSVLFLSKQLLYYNMRISHGSSFPAGNLWSGLVKDMHSK